MDGVGFLFMTAGGHLKVKDDDTVTLGGGRKWKARHTAEGLHLTIGHAESTDLQQVHGRKAGIKNEVGAGASSSDGRAPEQDVTCTHA